MPDSSSLDICPGGGVVRLLGGGCWTVVARARPSRDANEERFLHRLARARSNTQRPHPPALRHSCPRTGQLLDHGDQMGSRCARGQRMRQHRPISHAPHHESMTTRHHAPVRGCVHSCCLAWPAMAQALLSCTTSSMRSTRLSHTVSAGCSASSSPSQSAQAPPGRGAGRPRIRPRQVPAAGLGPRRETADSLARHRARFRTRHPTLGRGARVRPPALVPPTADALGGPRRRP